MTVAPLQVPRRLRSSGDAAVWIAPRPDAGTAHVLHFTTADGRGYAIELTGDDLDRIADTADDILAATPAEVDRWLDKAAAEIQAAVGARPRPKAGNRQRRPRAQGNAIQVKR